MEGCGTVPKILLVEDNQAAVVKIRQFIENIDTTYNPFLNSFFYQFHINHFLNDQ